MNVICSISGIDGTGKSTQIEKLKENYYDYIDVIGGLEKYDSFPKLKPEELHKWWFEDTTPENFCDCIYSCISKRNEDIKKCQKRIIIIDKGWINFDVRIKATLILKGLTEEKAQMLIEQYKLKYNIEDLEDLKICITSKDYNSTKIQDDSFNSNEQDTYKKYLAIQREYINQSINNGIFDEVLIFEDGINLIFKKLKKQILNKFISKINVYDRKISLLEEMQYIGNSINYINYDIIRHLADTEDDFKIINKLLDIIENNDMENIQVFNYNYEHEMTSHNFNKLNNYKREMLPFVSSDKYETKPIEKFNIPEYYKNILMDVFSNVQKEFSNNINLFLIHGSAGRECMHEGWSDLDIIMVLEKYNFEDIIKLEKIIARFDIKIGTTIYSKYEAESLLIDAKTLYSLYLMQSKELMPSIFHDLKIPEIKYRDLVLKNMQVLPEAIHKLKRLLYNENADNKSIIKPLNLIMKVILINDGVFSKSYREVFETFSEKYNVQNFEIEKYLSDNGDSKLLKEYAKYILENIVNM